MVDVNLIGIGATQHNIVFAEVDDVTDYCLAFYCCC